MVWLTQVIFYSLPWLMWNDRQAVLFDLTTRRFYIFNLVLYPQDFIYLTTLLIISALALSEQASPVVRLLNATLYDALQDEPMSHELLSDMAALLLASASLSSTRWLQRPAPAAAHAASNSPSQHRASTRSVRSGPSPEASPLPGHAGFMVSMRASARARQSSSTPKRTASPCSVW